MKRKAVIHVVEDDDSLRSALLRLLKVSGYDAKGYSSTGDFLLQFVPGRIGCLRLDIRLPGPSGLELHDAIRQQKINLPVIFMTGFAEVQTCLRAMKAGALDFLEKPLNSTKLLAIIEQALAVNAQQQAADEQNSDLMDRFSALSPREREVFDRVVAGMLNKQIAEALGIAERTVKSQRARVMEKLGVTSVAELGRLAERMSPTGVNPAVTPSSLSALLGSSIAP